MREMSRKAEVGASAKIWIADGFATSGFFISSIPRSANSTVYGNGGPCGNCFSLLHERRIIKMDDPAGSQSAVRQLTHTKRRTVTERRRSDLVIAASPKHTQLLSLRGDSRVPKVYHVERSNAVLTRLANEQERQRRRPDGPNLRDPMQRAALADPDSQLQEDERQLMGQLLPFDFVLQQGRNILLERRLLRDFLLYVPFLALFLAFFMGRRNFAQEYFAVEMASRQLGSENMMPRNPIDNAPLPYYVKSFFDIDQQMDWYDWLEALAVPKLFPHESSVAPQDVRFVTSDMIPIGAVRIRAKHILNGTCEVNKQWYPPNMTLSPRDCYGAYSSSHQMTVPYEIVSGQRFEYKECENSLLLIVGRQSRYGCGGYNVDIPTNTNRSEALRIVRTMRNGKLANVVTVRFLSLEFYAYIPSLDGFLACRMILEVTPGGGFIPWNYVRVFYGHSSKSGVWLAVDIAFAVMVLASLVRLRWDYQAFVELTGSGMRYFLNLGHLFTIVNLVLFLCTLISHFIWIGVSWNESGLFPPDDIGSQVSYPLRIALIDEFSKFTLYFSSVNAVISALVVLRFARANRRLNIVQRALKSILPSLIAVLIIFVIVIVCYALAGTLIFGTGVQEYRDISAAIVTLFRALQGDFDYMLLWRENRALAFVYFWSFIILGLFILLNFTVAILMRGFSNEQRKERRRGGSAELRSSLARSSGYLTNLRITLASALRGRETPESMLCTALAARAAELQQAGIDDLGLVFMSRHDFTDGIPPVDQKAFGIKFFDNLWVRFVDAFDDLARMPTDKTKSEVAWQVYESARDAAADVFSHDHARLFGYQQERDERIAEDLAKPRAAAIATFGSAAQYWRMKHDRRARRHPVFREAVARVDDDTAALDDGDQPLNMSDQLRDLGRRVRRLYRPPQDDAAEAEGKPSGAVRDIRQALDDIYKRIIAERRSAEATMGDSRRRRAPSSDDDDLPSLDVTTDSDAA
jgi:hypothetical protein